jgi:hypothetical protein
MMLSAAADVLRRASNKELVECDIKVVGNYVRGNLFTRTIFVFDNKQLDEGGPLHKDYLKNCQSLLANGTLTDLNDDAVVQYMNTVWARMTKEGQYKAWLSRKDQMHTRHFRIHSKVSCSCVLQPLVCLFA